MDELAHAMTLHRSGRLAEAEAAYRKLLETEPENARLLSLMGLLACQTGRLEEAAELLSHAARADPGSAEYQINLGEVQRRRGRAAEALAAFSLAAQRAPESPVAHYNLAAMLAAAGRRDAAVEHYQQALRLKPDYAEAHNNLGMLLSTLGRHEEALASLTRARDARPPHAEVENNLGLALWNLSRYREALEAFDRALRLKPDFAAGHANRGWVLRRLGQPLEAIAAFSQAARLSPGAGDIQRALAMALSDVRNHEGALAAARQAVKVAPEQAESHHALGVVLGALARTRPELRPEAIACFQKALAMDKREEWEFELAILEDRTPPASPDSYVRRLFDDYAPTFDKHLLDHLHYRVPGALLAALRQAWLNLPARSTELDILDLGQGTGLCGELLRPHARSLTGIDLSPKMTAAAQQRMSGGKPLYDRLIIAPLLPALREFESAFDVVVAGDVLIYTGALQETFAAVTRALRPEGLFCFTLERHDGPEPYILRERYRHEIGHIRRLAEGAGLKEIAVESCQLRTDVPPGWLVLLRK